MQNASIYDSATTILVLYEYTPSSAQLQEPPKNPPSIAYTTISFALVKHSTVSPGISRCGSLNLLDRLQDTKAKTGKTKTGGKSEHVRPLNVSVVLFSASCR